MRSCREYRTAFFIASLSINIAPISFYLTMKIIFSFLFLTITILLTGQDITSDLRKEIDKIIRYDTDIPEDHPGFLVGIIDGDSTYTISFGKDTIGNNELFELGGLSKVFTSLLVVRLQEEGLLQFSDKINDHLPSNYKNELLDKFTIEDLLLHRINFPKRPSDLASKQIDHKDIYAYYTAEDLLNFYKTFVPNKEKGKYKPKLHYSHISYALLGIIIERVTDKDYSEVLVSKVLQSLSLQETFPNHQNQEITTGYNLAAKIPPLRDYNNFTSSEGMISSMSDLILFTKKNIEADQYPLLLKGQEITEKSKISKSLRRTLAWYILKSRKTGAIFTHSGGSARHKAYIHYKKETKTGVIILSRSSAGTEELGMLVLRLINKNWKRK